MKVAFGISLSPGTPLLQEKDTRGFIDLARMADDYGAEAVGTHDTAFIGGDAYVRATLIALGATRARVGLRPTNPITRFAPADFPNSMRRALPAPNRITAPVSPISSVMPPARQ